MTTEVSEQKTHCTTPYRFHRKHVTMYQVDFLCNFCLQVCRFELNTLGGDCTWQKDYGYDEGKPCVVVKLNRVIGWRPEPYDSIEQIREIDREAAEWIEANGRFDTNYVPITCQGRVRKYLFQKNLNMSSL